MIVDIDSWWRHGCCVYDPASIQKYLAQHHDSGSRPHSPCQFSRHDLLCLSARHVKAINKVGVVKRRKERFAGCQRGTRHQGHICGAPFFLIQSQIIHGLMKSEERIKDKCKCDEKSRICHFVSDALSIYDKLLETVNPPFALTSFFMMSPACRYPNQNSKKQ